MKKLTSLTVIAILVICFACTYISAQAAGKFDYHKFEGSKSYTFDNSTQKWEFRHMAMISADDTSSISGPMNVFYLTFSGKENEKIYMPPVFLVQNTAESNGKQLIVVLGISQEKFYEIKKGDGSEVDMIPLTEARRDMVEDMAQSDQLAVYTKYDSGNEYTFAISGDDYKPIKEYCELLLKAEALSAADSGMSGYYEGLYSISTITKEGNSYTASNKTKALSDGKAYLEKYYCSYDGLISYLQTASYSYDDAKYAADNCGANWNEEALGAAKSMIRTSTYSYDELVKSLQRKGFTYDQAVYAADNCGANWSNAAVQEAKDKLKYSHYSHDGLIKALQRNGYSYEDATAAVDQCGADWKQQALGEAKDKLKYSHYSYEGLIKALQRNDFTYEEAVYAADNCGADWKQQALGEAKDKLKYSHYSYKGLIKALQRNDFTYEEAVYGADKCGADWNEQAVGEAQDKLKYSTYTYDELVRALQRNDFTYDEAKYGADNCGQKW